MTAHERFVSAKTKGQVHVQVAPDVWLRRDGSCGPAAAADRASLPEREALERNFRGEFTYSPPRTKAQEGGE